MNETRTWYNYFSIGLDAKFCHGFHQMREERPYLFKSRVGNKYIYTHLGAVDLLSGGMQTNLLEGKIKLTCDGEEIILPK